MPFSAHPSNVEYLRLFFAEDQEETALMLARLFLQHLGDADRFIHPDDLVEDLIGWSARPDPTIVAFLITMEEEQVFPKEALNSVDTFRELVEYVAARSRPRKESHVPQPNPLPAHNSFTIL